MKNHGYIALTSITLIGFALITLIATISLISINQSRITQESSKTNRTRYLVESCVEEALWQIHQTNEVAPSISLPEGNCSVTINTQAGNDWDISISNTEETPTHSIRLSLTRDQTISIKTWEE